MYSDVTPSYIYIAVLHLVGMREVEKSWVGHAC